MKGYPGHTTSTSVVETKSPKVTFRNLDGKGDTDIRWIWTPQRTWKERPDGSVIESRDMPREAFKNHAVATSWDNLHLLYFSGYAVWNYVHAPFYFTWPGFATREIESHFEGQQKWRVLEVTYPDGFPTHCKVQKFYFDGDYKLKRLDYKADVAAGGSIAHYCFDHRKVDGLLVPMLRRAVLDPAGIAAGGRSAVLLDFVDVVVRDDVVPVKEGQPSSTKVRL